MFVFLKQWLKPLTDATRLILLLCFEDFTNINLNSFYLGKNQRYNQF